VEDGLGPSDVGLNYYHNLTNAGIFQRSKFDFFEKLHENTKGNLEALRDENAHLREILTSVFDALGPMASSNGHANVGMATTVDLENEVNLLLSIVQCELKGLVRKPFCNARFKMPRSVAGEDEPFTAGKL
jgi:hypothetical protein